MSTGKTPFVHLHDHSEFSLLGGATKIKDIVKYAVDNDMPAIADSTQRVVCIYRRGFRPSQH